ncbi:MAG: hypothetical protein N2448_07210 [Caloramator sp.]|nr:hypothetical protein [Caloramator sp.]
MENEILELLKSINNKLDEHTKILNEHTKILNEHTQTLDEHKQILNEHTQILRALEHSSEVHKAEIDKLNITVARIEGEVKGIRDDLTALEVITSKNWNDISKLKAVK